MTTLADRIAAFETQANQLLDLPQQIADTAQARINQIGAYWDVRVQQMRTVAHVDPGTGDDANDGSVGSPLRTVEEALRRTPPGGVCTVFLLGNLHIPQEGIEVDNRWLHIVGSQPVGNPVISLEQYQFDLGGTTWRGSGGFVLREMGHLNIVGCSVQIPDGSGAWSGYPLNQTMGGLVQVRGTESAGHVIVLRYCEVTIPATPHCPLVGSYDVPLQFYATSLTVSGTLEGNVFSQVTSPTSTANLPWLVTNLTTV